MITQTSFRKAIATTLLLLLAAFSLPLRLANAVEAANNDKPDAVALGEAIRKLGTIASLLHTGAHPDDEDSGLLAYMARGRQARTAYLSLTRGDGGQNLIGPELYEALGVIRTEELLAARKIDGAQQFFTRAYEFGFSKTREETLSKWNQEELLRDMVRVIRTFRPLVIVPVFTGTPNDGHGHHQAAGYLTPIAYRDAADPARFPEQIAEGLKPWKAKKLFIRAGTFQQPRTEPSKEKGVISVNTGQFDSLFGRSYYEIAMQGRSQHRSQDQGAIQQKGPRYSFYKVVDSAVGAKENEQDMFDGIDVSLTGIAEFAGKSSAQLKKDLAEVQKSADEARETYNPFATAKLTPVIAQGLKKLREVRNSLATLGLNEAERYDTDFLLKQKEADFVDALVKAEGVVVDCLSDDEIVTPGQAFNVTVSVYKTLNHPRAAVVVSLNAPNDWGNEKVKERAGGNDERLIAQTDFKVTVAKDAEATQSYWLKNPRKDDFFVPGSGGTGIEPQAPQPVIAKVELEIAGQKVTLNKEAQYRYADKALGEIRRELKVAPAVSVNVSPSILVSPLSTKTSEQEIRVTVVNNSKEKQTGFIHVGVPSISHGAEFSASPEGSAFNLIRKGEQASFTIKIKVPPNQGSGDNPILIEAKTFDGRRFSEGYQLISYTHIDPRVIYKKAEPVVKIFDVKVAPNLKVGFIEGAGDDFANALTRLGVNVHIIDSSELATGDLSRYDTIVTGIRVYEVRPDVVANNNRLLDYVKNGGTLIVQYNKGEYARGNFAPYPVKMPQQGFERVTEEDAKVTILEPAHPLFNLPNKITEKDFAGWSQERGAYFLIEWDARFKPLMASHDKGEQDKPGGEVIAEYGRGLYVYTSYAWFRQLPNGVPGAYRLIANLVSLPKTRTPGK